MKKLMTKLMCAAAMVGIVGCTLTLAQKTAIARQAGVVSARVWIGTDSPRAAQVDNAKNVATLIRDSTCTNCSDGAVSYYDTLMPLASDYIAKNVKPDQQAMATLAASFMLTGLETYLAANPDSATQKDAKALAYAFCDGFLTGLNMAPTDPVAVAACRHSNVRVKLLKLR